MMIYITGTQRSDENADVIVVLGAGVRSDGSPDLALTRRTLHAADLWLAGRAPLILCSGGMPEERPRSEAAACQELLVSKGVPEEVIFLEERSRSTEENAIYSKELLQRENLDSVLLVTDSYHMFRANYIFNRYGIETLPNPVSVHEIPGFSFHVTSFAREVVAFHWQLIKDSLHLPFTYVSLVQGERITFV